MISGRLKTRLKGKVPRNKRRLKLVYLLCDVARRFVQLCLPPPGPGFAIFSVIQLLLPVMSLWLQRSHGDHSYWDVAAANFKHAIGLCCELVVEHVNSFIHSGVCVCVSRGFRCNKEG